jgi:hypothetical protein
MTRTLPLYVDLDELDLIIVTLMAAQRHGGIAKKSDGSFVPLTLGGLHRVDELVERLTLLNHLELDPS